jgi:hypothetical protein
MPQNVRLRRSRSVHFPDETAWFTLRADDYYNALQSIRDSAACGFFLDMSSLEPLLQTLCAGQGSAQEALTVHRALDAGLFAVGFESGHGLQQPATDFATTHNVPTLSALAGPAEPATRARA